MNQLRWKQGLAASTLVLLPAAAAAELWRSPLHDQTYVLIEKRAVDPTLDAEQTLGLPPEQLYQTLPADVTSLLGPRAVDYPAAVATYLPAADAAALLEAARAHELLYEDDIDRRVELPWHTFVAGDTAGRDARGWKDQLAPAAVPGLYLLQFAYPVQEEWIAKLEQCSAEQVAFFQQRIFLVKAPGLNALVNCPLTPFLSWIDAWRTTDRMDPEMLDDAAEQSWVLQYLPRTDLGAKIAALGPNSGGATVADSPIDLGAFVEMAAPTDLRAVVASDPDLLSLTIRGEAAPSDERQGQIVAGNHDGIKPAGPGYLAWLQGRGLLTPSNQPVVGIVDSGYDDGGPPTPAVDHHPDLENPERLIGLIRIPNNGRDTTADPKGHGTMVAGIIAGHGALGTGALDANGYSLGTGIVPNARLAIAKIGAPGNLDQLKASLAFCRNDPATAADRAHTINFSFNLFIRGTGNVQLPINKYDDYAKFFDARVLDGNDLLAGQQSTTIVFSAGNHAHDYATGNLRMDSVGSPATAKNVITVGATTSYRPAPVPPLDCKPQVDGGRPPNQDATHIAQMGVFSGRGRTFTGSGPGKVHTVRVKPDLVAPGVRIFSTVPYNFSGYDTPVGCQQLWPLGSTTFHTYGTGTSFSAPVVTGVAALARKWILDRGGSAPSPSLIKAALIATADSIGGLLGNDHRPSPHSGWGRVNLNRLTDASLRFFRDSPDLAVSSGQDRFWTRTISNASVDTYIVLAWSDPPTETIGDSQASLRNNLRLSVEEVPSNNRYWRGNNFRENITGIDNGYSHRFGPGANPKPVTDSINNVEAIFIPANTFPAGQKITIRIFGESVTAGPQRFSFYSYNVRPNS